MIYLGLGFIFLLTIAWGFYVFKSDKKYKKQYEEFNEKLQEKYQENKKIIDQKRNESQKKYMEKLLKHRLKVEEELKKVDEWELKKIIDLYKDD